MNELEATITENSASGPEPGVQLVDIDDITPDENLVADVRRTRITTPLTRALLALVVV
ncbi:MAG: hypothetical protein QOH10_778, partial [Actinomycetota bacterium]|nr:hypothetical protein [Actinomycetota bacterium]